MNIYDISEIAGVSIATVSRVLNGSTNVSDKTRQRVLEAIEQNGYTPNIFARSLGLNTMRTIGLLCTDSSDIYQAKAIYYIEQLLGEHGYDSLLCCSGYDLESKESCVNLLLTKKVDALILIGSSFVYEDGDKNRYIEKAGSHIPVMLLNAALDVPNVYGVLSNDFASSYHAVRYLYQSGCRHILYVNSANSYSAKRKLAGYYRAMEELGLQADSYNYEGNLDDIQNIGDCLSQLQQDKPKFDSVIAAEDRLAVGAVKYAKRAGIQIPSELSIIGFNNSVLACCSDPELTSIDVRLEVLCGQLVSNLMQVIKGVEIPQRSMFSSQMAIRQTTRPVP